MTDHNRPFSDDERDGLYRAIFERRDVAPSSGSMALTKLIRTPLIRRLNGFGMEVEKEMVQYGQLKYPWIMCKDQYE